MPAAAKLAFVRPLTPLRRVQALQPVRVFARGPLTWEPLFAGTGLLLEIEASKDRLGLARTLQDATSSATIGDRKGTKSDMAFRTPNTVRIAIDFSLRSFGSPR